MSLELIFDKHQTWVDIVCSFGCNPDTAEDLTQEMYIRVDQHIKNGKDFMYDDEVNYYFIYLILLNLFRDLKRKEKDVKLISIEYLPELPDIDTIEVNDELVFEKCRAIEEWLNDSRYNDLLNEGTKIDEFTSDKMNAFYLRNIFEQVFLGGKKLMQFSRDTNISYWSLRNTVKVIKKEIKNRYETRRLSSNDN